MTSRTINSEQMAMMPRSNGGGWWRFIQSAVGFVVVMAIVVAVLFGVFYFGKMAYNHFTAPAAQPVVTTAPQASVEPVSKPETHRVYIGGKYEEVVECTKVTDDCGSMELGKPADYGTGTHVSADGRTRPNPPAGWEWSGK